VERGNSKIIAGSAAILLLVLSIVFAMHIGAGKVSLRNIFSLDDYSRMVLFSLRLPRILSAALVGAILASCGAAIQGLFRNPLADPSLIGVTAGASLGGASVIFFGQMLQWQYSSLSQSLSISLGASLGALLFVALVFRLARNSFGTSVATMLLVGIALTAFASSITSLFEYLSDNQTLRRISLWRMGNLESSNYLKVTFLLVTATFCSIALQTQAKSLNAILLGEAEARHLGIDTEVSKRWVIAAVAIGTGVTVAVAGAIAFVGLIVPHFVRMMFGPNHRILIPFSAAFGAILLVCADTCARTVLSPSELPAGLLTALLGAPFFIALLRRRLEYGF